MLQRRPPAAQRATATGRVRKAQGAQHPALWQGVPRFLHVELTTEAWRRSRPIPARDVVLVDRLPEWVREVKRRVHLSEGFLEGDVAGLGLERAVEVRYDNSHLHPHESQASPVLRQGDVAETTVPGQKQMSAHMFSNNNKF